MLNKQRQDGGFLSALEDTTSVIGRWSFPSIGVTFTGIKQRITNAARSGDLEEFQRCFIFLFLKTESSIGNDKAVYERLFLESQVLFEDPGLVNVIEDVKNAFVPSIEPSEQAIKKFEDLSIIHTGFNPPVSQKSVEKSIEAELGLMNGMFKTYYWTILRNCRLIVGDCKAFCASCYATEGSLPSRKRTVLTFVQAAQPESLITASVYCHEIGHALFLHRTKVIMPDFMVAETVAHTYMFILMQAIAKKAGIDSGIKVAYAAVANRLNSVFDYTRPQRIAGLIALETARAIYMDVLSKEGGFERFLNVVELDGLDYNTMIKMLDLKGMEGYSV